MRKIEYRLFKKYINILPFLNESEKSAITAIAKMIAISNNQSNGVFERGIVKDCQVFFLLLI